MYSRSSTLGYMCVYIYWAILRVLQKPTTTILLVVDTHLTTSITTSDKSDHTTQYFEAFASKPPVPMKTFATHQGWRKPPNYRYSWQSPPSCLGSHLLNPRDGFLGSHASCGSFAPEDGDWFLLTLKKSMFCWSLWSRLFFAILCRLQGWGNPCSDLKNANRIDQMILLHNCYCIGILEHDSQPSQLQSSTAERPPLRLGDRRVCPGRQLKASGSSTVEFDMSNSVLRKIGCGEPKETRSCHQPKSKNISKQNGSSSRINTLFFAAGTYPQSGICHRSAAQMICQLLPPTVAITTVLVATSSK